MGIKYKCTRFLHSFAQTLNKRVLVLTVLFHTCQINKYIYIPFCVQTSVELHALFTCYHLKRKKNTSQRDTMTTSAVKVEEYFFGKCKIV